MNSILPFVLVILSLAVPCFGGDFLEDKAVTSFRFAKNGKTVSAKFFDKNGTQKTFARLINWHVRSKEKDPKVKAQLSTPPYLQAELMGLTFVKNKNQSVTLFVVGRHKEIQIEQTVPISLIETERLQRIDLKERNKSISKVGKATGSGYLEFRWNANKDTLEEIKFYSSLKVSSWLAKENDSVLIEIDSGWREPLTRKPLANLWD